MQRQPPTSVVGSRHTELFVNMPTAAMCSDQIQRPARRGPATAPVVPVDDRAQQSRPAPVADPADATVTVKTIDRTIDASRTRKVKGPTFAPPAFRVA